MINRNEATSVFWSNLLVWFQANKRNYPWRFTKDPYHVLIAEFLLQQTHVRKVEVVYHSLLTAFPNVEKLSLATEKELLEIIRPIGLTYRAARLKASAQIIHFNFIGRIPDNYNDLIKLPGVGDYIANAVLCYAYNQATIPIDTNVIRLLSRYFGLMSDKSRPRTDKLLFSRIRELYFPDLDYKTANLAVLDFAGIICTANNPECTMCPLNVHCVSYNKEPHTHSE
jgi:A/G-specific adenine glycosylase